jgi:hypothetical protein
VERRDSSLPSAEDHVRDPKLFKTWENQFVDWIVIAWGLALFHPNLGNAFSEGWQAENEFRAIHGNCLGPGEIWPGKLRPYITERCLIFSNEQELV